MYRGLRDCRADRLLRPFETNLEDGSGERVAKDIVKLWDDIIAPNGVKEVERLESLASGMKGKKVHVQEEVVSDNDEPDDEDEDGDDWTDEEEEVPRLLDSSNDNRSRRNPEPEVDEDGFTTVKRKR